MKIEILDASEVAGVTGVERDGLGNRGGGYETIVRARRRFAACGAQRGSYPSECTRCGRVERDGLEVCLCLLQVDSLAVRSSSVRARCGPTDSSASVTALITG